MKLSTFVAGLAWVSVFALHWCAVFGIVYREDVPFAMYIVFWAVALIASAISGRKPKSEDDLAELQFRREIDQAYNRRVQQVPTGEGRPQTPQDEPQ